MVLAMDLAFCSVIGGTMVLPRGPQRWTIEKYCSCISKVPTQRSPIEEYRSCISKVDHREIP